MTNFSLRFSSTCATLVFSCCLFAMVGCDRGPETIPLEGRVTYGNQPLEFGTVIFQPSSGQPARGKIQPDGTFSLSTFRPGDGVVPGKHLVRITCYETDRPGATVESGQEIPVLGESLIPVKYGNYQTSGLEMEIGPQTKQPVEFNLANE